MSLHFCRCPYYEVAQQSLYGTLNVTDSWATSYWGQLLGTNLAAAQCGIALPSLPYKFRAAFFADANNPICGEYLQLTSQYPGRGPCYPVLVETVDYFNRWLIMLVQYLALCAVSHNTPSLSMECAQW